MIDPFSHSYVQTYECPEVLKHPFHTPRYQLVIIVLEAFFAGLLVGGLL